MRTAWAVVLPLAAVVAASAACGWAATRAVTADRPLITATGAVGAVLLGVVVALAMSRRRLARELRFQTAELRAEAYREAERHSESARLAAIDLEAAQRAARATEVQRRTAAEAQLSLRAALKAETARAAALEGETARLAEVTIPMAVDRLRAGGSADTVMARLPQPTGPAHQRLLGVLIREIAKSERMRAAGMAACASAASRMQALTTGMLADLREMEDRLGEEVLGDLLHLDHCTAQTGRLADSVAVLTGSRSGRRWTKPIVMESVLRGAMGRIGAYQRVRLHSTSTAAVAGYAAEGVMHALAELLDNACNFSPPTEEVHVYVQETHSGVVITIEDAGLVMPDATLLRAQKLVSGDPLDLRVLSGTRLGLAVVGCLARKHGLLISFRPSSRGGTGVVVLIPPRILTQSPAEHAADYPVEEGGYGAGEGYRTEGGGAYAPGDGGQPHEFSTGQTWPAHAPSAPGPAGGGRAAAQAGPRPDAGRRPARRTTRRPVGALARPVPGGGGAGGPVTGRRRRPLQRLPGRGGRPEGSGGAAERRAECCPERWTARWTEPGLGPGSGGGRGGRGCGRGRCGRDGTRRPYRLRRRHVRRGLRRRRAVCRRRGRHRRHRLPDRRRLCRRERLPGRRHRRPRRLRRA
ncbi:MULTISPECIES: sensor histidine kinase [unclassified Streptomyces]|uniref:sensor histidine kinase n=1 Tax=unclassified Streptomyces TaxID=2593676 RepID=UPI00210DB783|nr:ATP-binding protein [Streptomyces sp. DvalAA-14]